MVVKVHVKGEYARHEADSRSHDVVSMHRHEGIERISDDICIEECDQRVFMDEYAHV